MINKSYVGLTFDEQPIYRIGTAVFREEEGELIHLDEDEIREIMMEIEDDDSGEYPEEWYDAEWANYQLCRVT